MERTFGASRDHERPEIPGPARDAPAPARTTDAESDDENLALIAAAAAGDPNAFQQLYRKYFRLISVVIYQKIPAAADVEDLAQETFLHAWRGLPRLRDARRFVPWLLRIARHVVTDWHRAAARQPDDARGLADAAAGGDEPGGTMATAEERTRVLAALRDLPEPYRIVLTLRFLEDMTPAQIATRMGEPDGTIRNRIFRALEKLERILRPEKDTRR
jgi:RNA polymerase sigma-70 factor (ECF subfamily)